MNARQRYAVGNRTANFEYVLFIFLLDGLHFWVNVKVSWLLFVTREMAHYFYVIEFCKGV